MKKPIIGITIDYEDRGDYSKFPWYAIRKNYLDCILKYGGIPIPLIHSMDIISELENLIDGIVITGGNFDINPSNYGKKNLTSRLIKEERTEFEMKVCEFSFKNNIPILGICGGEQLLNVFCGGTLVQDIKTLSLDTIEHEQVNPRNETSHKVLIKTNTKLSEIVQNDVIEVNSAHHQSVEKLGSNLIISGKSLDGIIESIESTEHKWCIGVQWHPEFLITDADKKLIYNFVKVTMKQ